MKMSKSDGTPTTIEELALVIVSELDAGNYPGSTLECIEAILIRNSAVLELEAWQL